MLGSDLLWIGNRIILTSPIRFPIAKHPPKSLETHIKINKIHQKITFVNIEITFCLTHTNNNFIISIIIHFLEHQNLNGKKSLNCFYIILDIQSYADQKKKLYGSKSLKCWDLFTCTAGFKVSERSTTGGYVYAFK